MASETGQCHVVDVEQQFRNTMFQSGRHIPAPSIICNLSDQQPYKQKLKIYVVIKRILPCNNSSTVHISHVFNGNVNRLLLRPYAPFWSVFILYRGGTDYCLPFICAHGLKMEQEVGPDVRKLTIPSVYARALQPVSELAEETQAVSLLSRESIGDTGKEEGFNPESWCASAIFLKSIIYERVTAYNAHDGAILFGINLRKLPTSERRAISLSIRLP
ncbi:hypothetical protein BDF20DRAFT_836734 [Mycotypha africana]|uniref:uncharacterized protein n=1 Tax=Mycotypha africana TaxID=64632 RepID=UPI00230019A5|nr:uncharacterized protein BDF20DRAFT_836734 [Mycotypha africana]KAI8975320.1 hypothetical protein BDF20DRAFT_836734 [Mycotypha africana]